MPLSLRPATAADLDLLEHFDHGLYEVERTFESGLREMSRTFAERHLERLASPESLYLIAELEGQPVGMISAEVEAMPEHLALPGRECAIGVIYVEASARGQGVGAALVGACLDWARAQGATRVRAGIYFQNEASRALFRRFGLEPYHVMVLGTLA